MKRCVAYCRVSTEKEDQKNSLQNQMSYFQDKFEKMELTVADCGLLYRKNGTSDKIKGIFADEGISGTSYKKREAFNTMLKMARLNKFDLIYVKDTSRFARNVENFVTVINSLKQSKVEVYFEDIGTSSFDLGNEMTLQIMAIMAQKESRQKSISSKFGVRIKQRSGRWHAKAPYGYALDQNAPHCLKIIPEESKIIKDIFEKFLNKKGTGHIARTLNDAGIKTQKGMTWKQKQITDILDREMYTGKVILHTTEVVDIIPYKKIKVPEHEQIITQAEELRIIDDLTFAKAKKERVKRRRMFSHGHHISNKHLLSTLLYCGNCGSVLKRKKRHSVQWRTDVVRDIGYEWTCQMNDMYGKKSCPERSRVNETDFLESLSRMLVSFQKTNLKEVFKIYSKLLVPEKTLQTRLMAITSKLSEIQAGIDILVEQMARQKLTQDDFDISYQKLRKEKEALQEQKSDIELSVDENRSVHNKYISFKRRLKTVNAGQLTRWQLIRLVSSAVIIGGELEDKLLSLIKPQHKQISYLKLAIYNPVFMERSIFELLKQNADPEKGFIAERDFARLPIIFDLVGLPDDLEQFNKKYFLDISAYEFKQSAGRTKSIKLKVEIWDYNEASEPPIKGYELYHRLPGWKLAEMYRGRFMFPSGDRW